MIVQVSKVRPSGIRTVYTVNDDGSIQNRELPLCVKFPKDCIEVATEGTVWSVQGEPSVRSYTVNGFNVTEELLAANSASFLRPSGELLVRWISNNIEGVGDVKARRLVRAIPDLNKAVRDQDMEVLTGVKGISESLAKALINNWLTPTLLDVIEWLQQSRLPLGLADRLARVYGDDAVNTLKRDPFLLAAFGVSFEQIIRLVEQLGIQMEPDRLLAAIAENATNRHCQSTGSTIIAEEQLKDKGAAICAQLNVPSDQLIESGLHHGSIVKAIDGYQSLGSAIQEETVARFLVKCAQRRTGTGSLLAKWETDATEELIDAALSSYEVTQTFKLTTEQRDAVKGSVISPVTVLSGGAGTGKTTILRAILSIYDKISDGMAYFQVALSGRAAQRMAESTGREAVTIAKLIADHIGDKKKLLPDHLLLVIDEASMVDLLSAYKMVGILPYATRIIFVGDASQLPPVGAGLVFHAAMHCNLPAYELTQVKRQGEQSGIHQLATAIRNGVHDDTLLNSKSGDVSYTADASHANIVTAYRNNGGSDTCIILTPTRKGNLGVDSINKLLQSLHDDEAPTELYYFDDLHGWIPWITRSGAKLRLGDQIIVTANDYDADIRNGDLGLITEVFPEAQNGAFGLMGINGQEIEITLPVLSNLDLGYAITIHKSQGSQWNTCILLLPEYATYMIDQTLLYTAVTRPTEKLIVMGASSLVEAAIRKGSHALNRDTSLAARISVNLIA